MKFFVGIFVVFVWPVAISFIMNKISYYITEANPPLWLTSAILYFATILWPFSFIAMDDMNALYYTILSKYDPNGIMIFTAAHFLERIVGASLFALSTFVCILVGAITFIKEDEGGSVPLTSRLKVGVVWWGVFLLPYLGIVVARV